MSSQFYYVYEVLNEQIIGARGGIIVGTHPLVSTPSQKLIPFWAWLGIVLFRSSTEFTDFIESYNTNPHSELLSSSLVFHSLPEISYPPQSLSSFQKVLQKVFLTLSKNQFPLLIFQE